MFILSRACKFSLSPGAEINQNSDMFPVFFDPATNQNHSNTHKTETGGNKCQISLPLHHSLPSKLIFSAFPTSHSFSDLPVQILWLQGQPCVPGLSSPGKPSGLHKDSQISSFPRVILTGFEGRRRRTEVSVSPIPEKDPHGISQSRGQ